MPTQWELGPLADWQEKTGGQPTKFSIFHISYSKKSLTIEPPKGENYKPLTIKSDGTVDARKFTGDGSALQVGKETITAALAKKVDASILKGKIVIWSGDPNKLPACWALCDGRTKNGMTTPNLKGRFIVGYDAKNPAYNKTKKTGGEWQHKLTPNEMPSHGHIGTTDQDSYTINLNIGTGIGNTSSLAAVGRRGEASYRHMH